LGGLDGWRSGRQCRPSGSGLCPSTQVKKRPLILGETLQARVTVTFTTGILVPQVNAIEGSLKSLVDRRVRQRAPGHRFSTSKLSGSDKANSEASLKVPSDMRLRQYVLKITVRTALCCHVDEIRPSFVPGINRERDCARAETGPRARSLMVWQRRDRAAPMWGVVVVFLLWC